MSTSSSAPPYAMFYGAYYLGTVLSTAIYGITCMQTFFYYVHYQNDLKRTKIFVMILWMLNTIHEALVITATYKYVTTGLLIPNSFLTGNPEMALHVLPTALVSLCVRGYFVSRIYLLVGRKILVLLIWGTLAAVEFITALLYVSDQLYTVNGEVLMVGLGELGLSPFVTIGSIKLSVAVGMDILIAICMTVILIRKRARASFTNTIYVLKWLTVFSVNTGIWPALLALLTITLLHVFPTNIINYLPYLPLCSVYCNTLLANLNARAYIGGHDATYVVDVDLPPTVYEGTETSEQSGTLQSVSSAKEDESLGPEPEGVHS